MRRCLWVARSVNQIKMTNKDIKQLADKFSEMLLLATDVATIKIINILNQDNEPEICASHEFCDPNQIMIDAFTEVFQREPEIDPEYLAKETPQDNVIMNLAWQAAKYAGFNANHPNGFVNHQETYFEIVSHIIATVDNAGSLAEAAQEEGGRGRLYELAENLTLEFEVASIGKFFDGDYFDALDVFFAEKEAEHEKTRNN